MPNLPNHGKETVVIGNPDYAGEMKEREAADKKGMKITNCCHTLIEKSYGGKCPSCEAPNV